MMSKIRRWLNPASELVNSIKSDPIRSFTIKDHFLPPGGVQGVLDAYELMRRVYDVFDPHGGASQDYVWWRNNDDGSISCYVQDEGAFTDYTSMGCEEVTLANVNLLEQAKHALVAIRPNCVYHTQLLFVSLVRRELPLERVQRDLPKEVLDLFRNLLRTPL